MVYRLIQNADWVVVRENLKKWTRVYCKSYTVLGTLISSVEVSLTDNACEELQRQRQDVIRRLAHAFGTSSQSADAFCVYFGGVQHHWLEMLDMILCSVHLGVLKPAQVVGYGRRADLDRMG